MVRGIACDLYLFPAILNNLISVSCPTHFRLQSLKKSWGSCVLFCGGFFCCAHIYSALPYHYIYLSVFHMLCSDNEGARI